MRYSEICEGQAKLPKGMSDAQRHEWLVFIHKWLSGSYMGKADSGTLKKWQELAKLFPPKVSGDVPLYRLVTLPRAYASKAAFEFRPAPVPVSSWTKTLVGLDTVQGNARDFKENKKTARIAIKAMIPARLVLATPLTIRDAFMAFSHDYFERYPERITKTPLDNGLTMIKVDHPGFPETDPNFTMDEVGEYQDVLNRPGGHCRQYEYVVQTPASVDAKVVRVYRIGDKILRLGNDDPYY